MESGLLFLSSYFGRVPGSCCRSRQGCRARGRTPTPRRGPLRDRCRSRHSRAHVGRTDRQTAKFLCAWCWYDLRKKREKRSQIWIFLLFDITEKPLPGLSWFIITPSGQFIWLLYPFKVGKYKSMLPFDTTWKMGNTHQPLRWCCREPSRSHSTEGCAGCESC